jgi:hypothetical protein
VYLDKLYLSFNRLLSFSKIPLMNSLLPSDILLCRFYLDLDKFVSLNFSFFSNLNCLILNDLVLRKRKVFPFLQSNSIYIFRKVVLSAPIGYFRY